MKGAAVLIPGVLRGMGCDGEVRGTRPQQSPDLGPEYSEGFVLNAPADLAEGDYLGGVRPTHVAGHQRARAVALHLCNPCACRTDLARLPVKGHRFKLPSCLA